jgi:hypothetical protein
MYLLPGVHSWIRVHRKAADAAHRREVLFPEAVAAFRSLKQMCTPPVLGYPRPGERFIVDIGANNVGIGGVLCKRARSV